MFHSATDLDGWMDVWITCDFMFFSTVFQSYQDDRWMIKAVCNGVTFMVEKDFALSPRAVLECGITRSVGQGFNPQSNWGSTLIWIVES